MDVNPHTPPKTELTMESHAIPPPLWNPDAAGVWSFFLTPIFGSILVLKNWQAIGEKLRVRAGRIWLAVSIFMVIPSIFAPVIGAIYLITWYFAWQRKQTRYVKEHWGKQYPRKSWGAPLLIGIASLAAFGTVVAIVRALLGTI